MEMNGVSFDFEDVFNTSSSPSQFESVLEDIKPDVLQVDIDSILDIALYYRQLSVDIRMKMLSRIRALRLYMPFFCRLH